MNEDFDVYAFTVLELQEMVLELNAKIERLQKTINAKDCAIKTLQQERDDREMYWRDWNGRAANRAALLEGKIDQLQECCAKRGARMQIMREWMRYRQFPNNLQNFCSAFPEARDWFDKDGVPK